jgi:hypothetical protein
MVAQLNCYSFSWRKSLRNWAPPGSNSLTNVNKVDEYFKSVGVFTVVMLIGFALWDLGLWDLVIT